MGTELAMEDTDRSTGTAGACRAVPQVNIGHRSQFVQDCPEHSAQVSKWTGYVDSHTWSGWGCAELERVASGKGTYLVQFCPPLPNWFCSKPQNPAGSW